MRGRLDDSELEPADAILIDSMIDAIEKRLQTDLDQKQISPEALIGMQKVYEIVTRTARRYL